MYTKQCYDYHVVQISHGLKSGEEYKLSVTTVRSLHGYLSMSEYSTFSSNKEGSHPEQLQLLKSHPIILKFCPLFHNYAKSFHIIVRHCLGGSYVI